MTDLRYDDVTVVVDGHELVRRLDLRVVEGDVVGLVGPNGSGKTTALRAAYRALRPVGGTIWLGEDDLTALPLRQSARELAALTQDVDIELDFTVGELVALGRTPHLRGNRALGDDDRRLCHEAMRRLDVLHLADRGVLTLSGGERQRVHLARVLAGGARVLVLDEPTNHLDMRHQVELLGYLAGSDLTVLVVLHDLNLAAAACDRIGVLDEGRLVASGAPRDVLTAELVEDVFGVRVDVVTHPVTGHPQVLYALTETHTREGKR